MTCRRRRGVRRGSYALLVVLMLLAGCSWVPTSGPVVNVAPLGTPEATGGAEFVPSGPEAGETPTSIVEGFLDAMQATPVQTTVAREFLTRSEATTWNPQEGTLIYTTRSRTSGSNGHFRVQLSGANLLDTRGSWVGSSVAPTLHFSVVREHGEWRIARAPNRLVVPDSWFQTRFTQVALYFFDPTGRILVPEPVLLPAGPQLPTALIADLLRGPAPGLEGVERTFLPSGASGGLSVPVTNGVAQVSLSSAADVSDTSMTMMAAQIAWTLRQVASVHSLHMVVGGTDVSIGNTTEIPVTGFDQFDPAGPAGDHALYGLRGGVVVSSVAGGFAPVVGRWGHEQAGLRSFVVGPDEDVGAGVTSDGRSVVVGRFEDGRRRRYDDVGTALLRPAWDFADRLWLVDQNDGRARVSYLSDGQIHRVQVPGVTGQNVADFQVSLDGTRLVAVVRGAETDEVVVSRLRQSAHGQVTGGTAAKVISDVSEGPLRFSATVWHTPTQIVTLQQFSGTALIRTLGVDGSTRVYPGTTVTVGDHLSGLVGSPRQDDALFAVTRAELLDLSGHGDNRDLPAGITSVGYAA